MFELSLWARSKEIGELHVRNFHFIRFPLFRIFCPSENCPLEFMDVPGRMVVGFLKQKSRLTLFCRRKSRCQPRIKTTVDDDEMKPLSTTDDADASTYCKQYAVHDDQDLWWQRGPRWVWLMLCNWVTACWTISTFWIGVIETNSHSALVFFKNAPIKNAKFKMWGIAVGHLEKYRTGAGDRMAGKRDNDHAEASWTKNAALWAAEGDCRLR